MKFPFTKMHGIGNDFVVFDFTQHSFPITKSVAINIADRHFGIGCDQILIIEKSSSSSIDFDYRIFNADGSEVGQCGNGARCLAVFVRDKGLSSKSLLKVKTISGILELSIQKTGLVKVNMGVPNFKPKQIPMLANQQQAIYSIKINNKNINFSALSLGNPHVIVNVDEDDSNFVEHIGSKLEKHKLFPDNTNVGFMQLIDQHTIKLRVYERGVGETIACGSGACAAVVSGIQSKKLTHKVKVKLRGGDLLIEWDGEGSPVMMTGPATSVFTGEFNI